jgi:hypothetical protein
MTEKHPTSEGGRCTVRPFVSYAGTDPADDRVDVAIVTFDFELPSEITRVVLCLLRNRRTREVTTRTATTLDQGVAIMETWLGGPVPL